MPQSTLTGRRFEDAVVDEVIGPVSYGPLTIMHLIRWASVLENWHRIHYDYAFCAEHEGLPGPLINGTWKQQVLAQLLKDWAGPAGWLRSLKFSFRGMDVVGEMLRVQARVTSLERYGDYGEARCAVEMVNSAGLVSMVGKAVVFLPAGDDQAVDYPAPPPGDDGDISGSEAGRGLCPPRYRDYVDYTSAPLVSTDAIDQSSLRRFAQAIMSVDPDYFDAAGPGARKFGSVVAPPLYPLHALHVPAGADDPLERTKRDPDWDGASQTPWSTFGLPELPGAPKRILNGGNEVRVYAYAPLGSHIAVTSAYDDIYVKDGKTEPLLFISVLSQFSVHETGQPLLDSRQLTILR